MVLEFWYYTQQNSRWLAVSIAQIHCEVGFVDRHQTRRECYSAALYSLINSFNAP